jgi:GTP-binding protein EngB required for normal cell division
MPMVSLPTTPETHIMDAGLRDNYGGKVTIEYLFALEKWIQENTSGVLIVEMRDTKRILNKQNVSNITLIDKLKVPFSNMMDNFDRTQDYDQEQLMELSKTSFGFPVDIVSFNLRESVDDRISLSWHLTGREKQKIQAALNSPENRNSLLELKKHLGYNLDIR